MKFRAALFSIVATAVGAVQAADLRIELTDTNLDLRVRSAETVTGSQSNDLAMAVVHTNRTDNPHSVTAEQVGALVEADLSRVNLLNDRQAGNIIFTVENGTGTYWRVGTVTNYYVTLSPDFEETITHTRPAWTNHVLDFVDGDWSGDNHPYNSASIVYTDQSVWATSIDDYPVTLPAAVNAQGSAVVSQVVSVATSLLYTAASSVMLSNSISDTYNSLEARIRTDAQIVSVVNGLTTNEQYMTLGATNVIGFGTVAPTNPVQTGIAVAAPTNGQTIARWLVDLGVTGQAWRTLQASAYVQVGTVLGVTNIFGLAFYESDSAGTVGPQIGGMATYSPPTGFLSRTFTNSVAASFPTRYVIVRLTSQHDTTTTLTAWSGGATPALVAAGVANVPYATLTDSRLVTTNDLAVYLTQAQADALYQPLGGESAPTYIGTATSSVISVTSAGNYYVDLTDWPATGSTFAATVTLDWTPTVTGRYEFAFSDLGGGQMRGRMLYPSTEPFKPAFLLLGNYGTTTVGSRMFVPSATVTNNYTISVVDPRPVVIRLLSAISYTDVSALVQRVNAVTGSEEGEVLGPFVIHQGINMIYCAAASSSHCSVRIQVLNNTAGNKYLEEVSYRPFDELELSWYLSGGRP